MKSPNPETLENHDRYRSLNKGSGESCTTLNALKTTMKGNIMVRKLYTNKRKKNLRNQEFLKILS